MLQVQYRLQDKINLVLGSADNPLWTSAIVAEEHMPKLLDKYSDGRITSERFFGGKLCSEHNCIEQMGQGQVDIAKISLYNVGAFGQTFDFINLPLLWKNADTVHDIGLPPLSGPALKLEFGAG